MGKKVVFAWGRMNPPTSGHEKLVDGVFKIARIRSTGGDKWESHIYLSHSKDRKKNPLDYLTKVRIAKSAFGDVVKQGGQKTIIEVLKRLKDEGYTDVVLAVGSDRVRSFKMMVDKYKKDFGFDSFSVQSVGDRDPDGDETTAMSASKVRQYAVDGNRAKFDAAMPRGLSQKEIDSVWRAIRKAMGVSRKPMKEEIEEMDEWEWLFENISEIEIDAVIDSLYFEEVANEELDEVLSFQARRKLARSMKIRAPKLQRRKEILKKKMANKEKLQKRASKAAIKLLRKRYAGKRGENYQNLNPAARIQVDKQIEKRKGKVAGIARRMMPKVRKKEQERIKQVRSGGSEKNESIDNKLDGKGGAGEFGTNMPRKIYASATPGQ